MIERKELIKLLGHELMMQDLIETQEILQQMIGNLSDQEINRFAERFIDYVECNGFSVEQFFRSGPLTYKEIDCLECFLLLEIYSLHSNVIIAELQLRQNKFRKVRQHPR